MKLCIKQTAKLQSVSEKDGNYLLLEDRTVNLLISSKGLLG